MTDRYDQDLLLDYLEGDLDPAARAQVDQMLASDPALSSLMQSLAEDRTQLRAMPAEQAPGNLNFDLVQGLERRMLLDAPQVEPAAGPIPIARGHDMAPPVNGWRWGRIVGLTGMAAAIAMAAGLVIWFDQINPLSQTAFKMSAPAQESAGVQAPTDQAAESLAAGETGNELSNLQLDTTPAAPGTTGNIADHPGPEARLADNAGADRSRARNGGGAPEALDMEERQATPSAIDASVADVVAGAGAGAPTAAATRGGRAGGDAQPFALEPTISISALAPDQSLRIETDDPDTSKAQVLDWCLRNGVPIVEPQADAALAQADAPDEAPAQAPIAILIEQPQLDALLHEMNRDTAARRTNRQRAVVGEADDSFYNQPQDALRPAQLEAFADGDAQTQTPQLVELRVPEDLGDEQLTRQNIDNTWIYQNRADFANTDQREAQETLAALDADADDTDPLPPADNTEDENAVAADGAAHAEHEALPGEEGTPQGPMADALEESDQLPAAPRGNWLLTQVPLASTTSIWNDPPRALLVPVIFVRRMTEEAEPAAPADDAPADAEPTERADDTDEPITPATPNDD